MDEQMMLLVIVMVTLTVVLSTGLALWLIARLRRKSDQPLSREPTGAMLVPVRQLKRSYRLLGYSSNSINPKLAVTSDGLDFKLFKPDHWRFADIARVEFVRMPFVTRLEIKSRSDGRLYVDLADKARARDLLRALPADLPFTARALSLRENA
ncbi:hypothetical protein [Sphingosinicella sp. BN140058]|uniref:hypothetical protein n=1 Tax=Sphingosinicella sp. BN140058 TaxID=1892855 RepID=UPI0013EC2789|nr:hypothetical protein [Sphingosinicella sp. BN140058]